MEMADVKWINIPADFFDREPIRTLENMPESSGNILLYIELLCRSYSLNRKGIFSVGNIALTDSTLYCVFRYDSIGERLKVLEHFGLIKRSEKTVQVFKFWVDLHDRNSVQYREWRKSVFQRDGFCCVKCGTRANLQAHHIKSWKSNKALRYTVSNGVTLCKKCHLEAHGGCWKNG